VAPADHLQAAALAAVLDRKRIDRTFLVDKSERYGSGLRRMLARRLQRRGITVAGRGALRHRRASATLTKQLARSHAQAMVFTGITRNGAVSLWRKVHRRRPRLRLFGSDGDRRQLVHAPADPQRQPRAAPPRTPRGQADMDLAVRPASRRVAGEGPRVRR
jgi:hypothetical protein